MVVFPGLQAYETQLRDAKGVWIAFSGGLDSTVLLHQAAQLGLEHLQAVHVNHQLSPNAQAWERHCEDTANSLGVPLTIRTVSVDDFGGGVEDAARKLRYQIFSELLKPGEILLTAHHANDQAETLIYRLMRGAGLKGLCGVPRSRNLGRRKTLVRPFLDVARPQLEAWADDHAVRWIKDESNDDTSFDRNYIRHEVMPALSARWPGAIERIATSASLLAESQELLDAYLDDDLNACKLRKERVGESLILNVFLNFSEVRQHHLLRYWIGRSDCLMPSQQHLAEVRKLLLAAEDAKPEVSWGPAGVRGGSIYRYQNRLYLAPRLNYAVEREACYKNWDGVTKLQLGNFSIVGKPAEVGLAPGNYRVLFREGGERCQPADRQNSQTLKKLLQEYRLEPWLRDVVPLVYAGQELVAVGDLWICQGFETSGGFQPVWRIE